MEKKHIIWSDINLDLDTCRAELQEQFPEENDDFLLEMMFEQNGDFLDDERANLNIIMPSKIIAIANLGLWNGLHSGYKIIESGNIKDCLYPARDDMYNEWYVDKHGNLRGTAIHHDGRNRILYRAFKENLSEEQQQNFIEKILTGDFSPADVTRYTQRLGDEIGKVYGWNFPTKSRPPLQRRELAHMERN